MGGLCQHLRIEALRQQLAQWQNTAPWRGAPPDPAAPKQAPALPSGCPALDRLLPDGGFRPGTLVEWLSGGEGDGAATLAFRAAAEACHGGGAVVVLDRWGEFYPLAAVGLGIEPTRLIVVHPENKADHTWALDQVLRSPAVAAAVAWPDEAQGVQRDEHREGRARREGHTRNFRRLQLAAEQGGGLGLLIRPVAVRGEPSWADVRLLVEPLSSTSPYGQPRRMRIVLLRCRGGRGEQTLEVEIDDEPSDLSQS